MSAVAPSRRSGDLVLGVGNILWADEGFGVRCAEGFAARYAPTDTLQIMDGGTQGLGLVNILSEADRIVLFDAVDVGAAPASLLVVRDEEAPRFIAARKVSLHQTSMMEVLALAELLAGGPPRALTVIGCQPVELEDYGGGLTAPVAARVPEALALAAEELASWGVELAPATHADPVSPPAIARASYEAGRPSADAACRVGDARVLNWRAPAGG